MATIDGGSLSFTSELNNDQLKQAVSETIARVKGLSDASVQGGKEMADAFAKAAQEVRAQIEEVSDACQQHERAINDLKSKYNELGAQAGNAFMAGRDAEGVQYRSNNAPYAVKSACVNNYYPKRANYPTR